MTIDPCGLPFPFQVSTKFHQGSKVKVIESEVEAEAVASNIFDSPAIRHSATGRDPLWSTGVFHVFFHVLRWKKLEKLELDWTPGCLWFLKISVYQIRNICRFWSTDPTDFEDLTSTFVRIHHPAIQWLGSSYQATWRRTHDETQWIGGIFNRKAPILNGKIDSFQSSKRSSKLSL